MSKKVQVMINAEVIAELTHYNEEVKNCVINHGKRLRTCNAIVYETPNYYSLKSLIL